MACATKDRVNPNDNLQMKHIRIGLKGGKAGVVDDVSAEAASPLVVVVVVDDDVVDFDAADDEDLFSPPWKMSSRSCLTPARSLPPSLLSTFAAGVEEEEEEEEEEPRTS